MLPQGADSTRRTEKDWVRRILFYKTDSNPSLNTLSSLNFGSVCFEMTVTESYIELWSPESYSYESEDYAELADQLDAQVCEESEQEEKVCCALDQIKV